MTLRNLSDKEIKTINGGYVPIFPNPIKIKIFPSPIFPDLIPDSFFVRYFNSKG